MSATKFVKELLKRQKDQVNLLNVTLAESNIQRICRRTAILNNNQIPLVDKESLLIPAVEKRPMLSMNQFMEQYMASKRYSLLQQQDGSYRVISNDKFYCFSELSTRCSCVYRRCYLIMCRHEIVFYKKFIPEFFDISHYARTQATHTCRQISENTPDSVMTRETTELSFENGADISDKELHTSQSLIPLPDAIFESTPFSAQSIKSVMNPKQTFHDVQSSFEKLLHAAVRHSEKMKSAIVAMTTQMNKLLTEKLSFNQETHIVRKLEEFVVGLYDTPIEPKAAVEMVGTKHFSRLKSHQELTKRRKTTTSRSKQLRKISS
jgi:hypothetical protein